MRIESPVPGLVGEWLAQRPTDVRERVLAQLAGPGLNVPGEPSPAELVLRGLQDHAVGLGSPGDLRAVLALDAVGDLLPIVGARAGDLLLPATSFLLRLQPRPLHPEWCERAPLAESPVIYAGALDEILEAKELEEAGAGLPGGTGCGAHAPPSGKNAHTLHGPFQAEDLSEIHRILNEAFGSDGHEHHRLAVEHLKRMREIGLKNWLAEQERPMFCPGWLF